SSYGAGAIAKHMLSRPLNGGCGNFILDTHVAMTIVLDNSKNLFRTGAYQRLVNEWESALRRSRSRRVASNDFPDEPIRSTYNIHSGVGGLVGICDCSIEDSWVTGDVVAHGNFPNSGALFPIGGLVGSI